jgi:hypothetical protein
MRRIIEFFSKDNNKLEENIKRYEQKEKIKQQESKILGQKLIKETKSKKESTNM